MPLASFDTKSSSKEGIQRISSHALLADLLYKDVESFLSQLPDQSPGSLKIWGERLGGLGHKEVFFASAYCHYYGVLPEEYGELALRLHLSNQELFDSREEYEMTWYKSSTPFPRTMAIDRDGKTVIRPFDCEFRDIPIELCRISMESTQRGVPGVFALYLPPDEMRAVFNDLVSPVDAPHVLGAFGYIRYYQKGSDVEIAEIQSDYFEGLTTRSIKERFKHWEELLLLAFEMHLGRKYDEAIKSYSEDRRVLKTALDLAADDLDYFISMQAQRTYDRHLEACKRGIKGERTISIPLPSTIRLRWLKDEDSLAIERYFSKKSPDTLDRSAFPSGLAEQIYGRIPDRLGYIGEKSLNSTFVEENNWGQSIPQLITLQKKFRSSQQEQFHSSDSELFKDSLEEASRNSRSHLFKVLNELFPSSVFRSQDWGGFPISFPLHRNILRSNSLCQSIPGITIAPVEPSTLLSIPGITEAALKILDKYWATSELSQIRDYIQPEFTFFSLGVENGLARDWWTLPNYSEENHGYRGMAITDQKRHPSVRFYAQSFDELSNRGPQITIGSKGAGLTEHITDEYFLYKDQRTSVNTFPITLPAKTREEDIRVPSHQFWGGISVAHAEAEYRNHLGLWCLFDALSQNPLDRVAFPLNVGALHAIPVLSDGKLSWMSNHDYCPKILDSHSHDRVDHLGVFVSASKCDVRLSQVVNRIFSRSEESSECIEACEFEIRSALKYLFNVNGLVFIDEHVSLSIGRNGLGAPEFQDFVNRLLVPNRVAGVSLYKKLSKQLLTSLGMIHGAGGHVGGGYEDKEGAIGGGATAIRNIDCCGALHDLDLDVYLPWISPEVKVDKARIDRSQIFDLAFLKDSLYWLETLLLGRELMPSDSIQTLTIGSPFNKCAFFGDAPKHSDSPWLVLGMEKRNHDKVTRSLFPEENSSEENKMPHESVERRLTPNELKIYTQAKNQGVGFSRNYKKSRQSPESSTTRLFTMRSLAGVELED